MDFGALGFFFDAEHAIAAQFGDAKAVGVINFFQQNLRAAFLLCKTFHGVADVILNDVVAKNDADRIASGEIFRQAQRFGDSAFAFLVGVIQMLQAEIASIAEQAQKISGIFAAGYQQNLFMPALTSVWIG